MSRRDGNIAVIDIDSSRVKMVVANPGVNNSFVVKAQQEFKYDGFEDGKFYDEEGLKDSLRSLISSCLKHARPKVTKVYIGVPGEFTTVHVCKEKVEFENLKEISSNDVQDIFNKAMEDIQTSNYEVIGCSPIYYVLDGDKRVIQAVGEQTRTLEACVSFILLENYFKDLLNPLLTSMGLVGEYVSSALATALYVFEPEARDRYALLAQIGYISSSVMLVRGDGLLYLKSFPVGDGFISADLSEVFDIPFEVAEEIKNKANLCLALSAEDEYSSSFEGNNESFPATVVHDVIESRLGNVAQLIRDSLYQNRFSYPDYLPLTITGGYICQMKGAKEVISKNLDKAVVLADPKVAYPVSQNDTAIYGLLDLALKDDANSSKNSSRRRRR